MWQFECFQEPDIKYKLGFHFFIHMTITVFEALKVKKWKHAKLSIVTLFSKYFKIFFSVSYPKKRTEKRWWQPNKKKIAFSVPLAKFSHWNCPILAMHWFGKLGLLPTLHEIAADEGQNHWVLA